MPVDPVVKPMVWSTIAFAVASAIAVASPTAAGFVAIFDLVLFALGLLVFARTLLVAAQRSRTDELTIAGIWFLSGSAPPSIRLWLLGGLIAQVGIAFTSAGLRPYSPLAFGVLVPTFGLGLCGLWAVRSGTFPPRSSGTTN
ncbi:MAG: hypothetical protein QOI47_1560 [Actinomycetota bacterium]|jgi:hypothetical protein|nr:hypothetical protein [Actinomycetota bacterium]